MTSSPWQPLPMQQASSVFRGPSSMSPPVLFHRRQSRHHLPFPLRGCPCPVWVMLLPLAAGPRGMPCQPQLAVPVTRGGQLSAEAERFTLFGQLLLAQWPPSSHGPPYYGMGSFSYQVRGAVPLGLEGRVLICLIAAVRGPWPLATFSSVTACSRRWSTPPVRGCYLLLVRSRACLIE
jgi:hypothetical protein